MANHTNQHKPWLLFNNQSPENTPPHSHTQTHRPGLKGKDITTSPTVLIRSIYNTRVHKHLVWKATKLRVVFLHKILNSNALDETLLIQICRSMRSESTSEEILWIGIRCSFTHSCTHMPALSQGGGCPLTWPHWLFMRGQTTFQRAHAHVCVQPYRSSSSCLGPAAYLFRDLIQKSREKLWNSTQNWTENLQADKIHLREDTCKCPKPDCFKWMFYRDR